MTRDDQPLDSPQIGVNAYYASFQLHKSLATASLHQDAGTRERAAIKADKWSQAIDGMRSGLISTGSRVPVQGLPGWVTLEVLTGGFATGNHLAGGDLLEFERELLDQIQPDFLKRFPASNDRQLLNSYFLSQAGLDVLTRRLQSRLYEVEIPEEGALLVVAWLIREGRAEDAQNLLTEIIPFFSQVRFYPRPTSTPAEDSSLVFLRDVASVSGDLQEIKPTREIVAQRESISIWQPMYDRVVALFLETVEGQAPVFAVSKPLHNGTDEIKGGVPYANISAKFAQSAREFLQELETLRAEHSTCQKPRRKNNFHQLCEFLQKYIDADGEFIDADVNRIRVLLARYVSRRGVPGSEQHKLLRDQQAQQIAIPIYADLAKVVLERLASFEPKSGIEDLSPILADVAVDGETAQPIPLGGPLPDSMVQKIERCLMDSITGLIEQKIIKSGDSLAIVLPQITANLAAAGVADSHLRLLYSNIYRAFRRRRSLLLLSYESQVRLGELPWIAAIDGLREKSSSDVAFAQQTITEVAQLTLRAFPYAIVPNKLLQEFRSLAESAEIELPLVDELAADIFMGSFSDKFIRSAQLTGELLKNSLYATYYKIDFDEIARLKPGKSKKKGSRRWVVPNPAFASICVRRAGKAAKSAGYGVASNGVIIEQQQILTTQNLAAIYVRANLKEALGDSHFQMATKCFEWICNVLQIKTNDYHARLVFVKNSAYAWRQMMFYLSMMSEENVRQFLTWASEYVAKQDSAFVAKFHPGITGMKQAIAAHFDGQVLDKKFVPFVGWTTETHWLLRR